MSAIRKKVYELIIIGLACVALFGPLAWIGYKKIADRDKILAEEKAREKERQDQRFRDALADADYREKRRKELERKTLEKYPVIRKIRALDGYVMFDEKDPERPLVSVSFGRYGPDNNLPVNPLTDDILSE